MLKEMKTLMFKIPFTGHSNVSNSLLLTILFTMLLWSAHSSATSLEEKLIVSIAGGGMCKSYAEEVGGDVIAFSEMNAALIRVADKLGYTNDIDGFVLNVKQGRLMLEQMTLKQYESKVNVYNNWCSRLYNGYIKGVEEGTGVR